MIHWAWLILAAVAGSFIGMFTLALMTCSKYAEDAATKHTDSENNN